MSIITKTLKSSGYFTINKQLMRVLGLQKAIILSLFIDKADYYEQEPFFYTLESLNGALGGGISEKEIRATIKALVDENLLIDKGMLGVPAKRFFMINEIKISELFVTPSTSQNDRASTSQNDRASTSQNDRASTSQNDRANIINPHITNPNNINPNIQEEKNIKKEKSQTFKKPTLEEIKIYAKEINANFDSTLFFDYYEANGWRIGKNLMKDWKATMRMWKHRNQNNQSTKSQTADKELNDFFEMQTKDDPVLSNNWLSKGLPQEVKSYNRRTNGGAIPEDFRKKFLIGDYNK
ncbi:hypothetical protein A9K75_07860 [Campylobacter fetus subsp. testudinum]|uniref:hypothetical protein n=1 Tax=Campylobacter fetus TaxID=196 RepID=UPI000818BF54|nr:hypothetical protein [Campylobacter fetus]OCR99232.1 hypothetical protein A9K75_07860 [Campylobacter fetus subsp. testudinum]